jgi:hypothetical protein
MEKCSPGPTLAARGHTVLRRCERGMITSGGVPHDPPRADKARSGVADRLALIG